MKSLVDIVDRKVVLEKIQNELLNSEQSEIHGIFVFNLDDFDQINANYGRERGDYVLNEIFDRTSVIFKGTDFAARIKGDEFLVFIKNIMQISNAEALAERLLKTVSSIQIDEKNLLTVSLGITIYPYHGTSMEELIDKAYQAMYSAKANGKNRYRLYDAGRTKQKHHNAKYLEGNTLTENDPMNAGFFSNIDSLDQISISILYEDKDTISAANSIMELICIYLGFTRAFIVLENLSYEDQKLRYTANGYETGKETKIERMLRRDLVCRLYDSYQEPVLIYNDNSHEDAVNQYFNEQKIKEMLYYPVVYDDHYLGAILFENIYGNPLALDAETFSVLIGKMKTIQAYLLNMYSSRKNCENVVKLELFDNLDAYVYLVDYKTYDISFINRKGMKGNGYADLGAKCYRVLRNKETPCEHCPMKQLDISNPHASASSEFFNCAARKWTKNLYSWLDVRDSHGKCIVISVDINDFFEQE